MVTEKVKIPNIFQVFLGKNNSVICFGCFKIAMEKNENRSSPGFVIPRGGMTGRFMGIDPLEDTKIAA